MIDGSASIDALTTRLFAELNVRKSLESEFTSTKGHLRRDETQYVRNPTKVYYTTQLNSKFAFYDLPRFNETFVCKHNEKSESRNVPSHKFESSIGLSN